MLRDFLSWFLLQDLSDKEQGWALPCIVLNHLPRAWPSRYIFYTCFSSYLIMVYPSIHHSAVTWVSKHVSPLPVKNTSIHVHTLSFDANFTHNEIQDSSTQPVSRASAHTCRTKTCHIPAECRSLLRSDGMLVPNSLTCVTTLGTALHFSRSWLRLI